MLKFIITGAARSGSTMLRYMLDSHPQVVCHGEIFRKTMRWKLFPQRAIGVFSGKANVKPEDAILTKKWAESVTDFFESYVYDKVEGVSAYGIKYKTDEYFDPFFSDVSRYVTADRSIKVIHLKRRDVLAQYVSHELVRRGLNPTVRFEVKKVEESQSIKIDVKHLKVYFEDVLRREIRIEEELSAHEIINIDYEDLLIDDQEVTGLILSFLGVNIQHLDVSTKRLVEDPYRLIENKAEVLHCLEQLNCPSRYKNINLHD